MIKIKRTKPNGFYVFHGKPSANSVFIEDLEEARQFLIRCNYYFKGFMKIYDYLLTKDGWIILVRINSTKTIQKRITDMNLENASECLVPEDNVWQLISERVRIFLSGFVKYTNKKQGRTGSKVHSSYERFVFNSLSEASGFIEKLRNRMIKMHQSDRKYRSVKCHYKVPEKLGFGSIFICSKGEKKRKKLFSKKLETFMVSGNYNNVLHDLIRKTLKFHCSHNNKAKIIKTLVKSP